MKKIALAALCLIVVGIHVESWSLAADPSSGDAQELAGVMQLSPEVCNVYQQQINQVLDISKSSASDSVKIEMLNKIIAESIAKMNSSANSDTEVASAIRQYIPIIQGILTAAMLSRSENSKQVAPQISEDVQKLKILTSTYFNVMKMLCPNVQLPKDVIYNESQK